MFQGKFSKDRQNLPYSSRDIIISGSRFKRRFQTFVVNILKFRNDSSKKLFLCFQYSYTSKLLHNPRPCFCHSLHHPVVIMPPPPEPYPPSEYTFDEGPMPIQLPRYNQNLEQELFERDRRERERLEREMYKMELEHQREHEKRIREMQQRELDRQMMEREREEMEWEMERRRWEMEEDRRRWEWEMEDRRR